MTSLREYLWERDGGRCWLCGDACDPRGWEADHIFPRMLLRDEPWVVPEYAAEPDHPFNLAVAHSMCNRSRGHQTKLFGVLPDDRRVALIHEWTDGEVAAMGRHWDRFGFTQVLADRLASKVAIDPRAAMEMAA